MESLKIDAGWYQSILDKFCRFLQFCVFLYILRLQSCRQDFDLDLPSPGLYLDLDFFNSLLIIGFRLQRVRPDFFRFVCLDHDV